MSNLSTSAETSRSTNASKGLSLMIGCVVVLASVVLIINANIGSVEGQVDSDSVAGSVAAASSPSSIAYPDELLITLGILGIFSGIALVVDGATSRLRPRTLRKDAHSLFSSHDASEPRDQDRSLDAPPEPSATSPSRPSKSIGGAGQTSKADCGHLPRIRASERILRDSPVARSRAVGPKTLRTTPAAMRMPWVVEFVVPCPRSDRIELELRLSQLRSWKERGMITKVNYEEEKIKIMKRLHPSRTMI